VVRRSDIMDQR